MFRIPSETNKRKEELIALFETMFTKRHTKEEAIPAAKADLEQQVEDAETIKKKLKERDEKMAAKKEGGEKKDASAGVQGDPSSALETGRAVVTRSVGGGLTTSSELAELERRTADLLQRKARLIELEQDMIATRANKGGGTSSTKTGFGEEAGDASGVRGGGKDKKKEADEDEDADADGKQEEGRPYISGIPTLIEILSLATRAKGKELENWTNPYRMIKVWNAPTVGYPKLVSKRQKPTDLAATVPTSFENGEKKGEAKKVPVVPKK